MAYSNEILLFDDSASYQCVLTLRGIPSNIPETGDRIAKKRFNPLLRVKIKALSGVSSKSEP